MPESENKDDRAVMEGCKKKTKGPSPHILVFTQSVISLSINISTNAVLFMFVCVYICRFHYDKKFPVLQTSHTQSCVKIKCVVFRGEATSFQYSHPAAATE